MLLSNFIHKTEQLQDSSINQLLDGVAELAISQRLGFLAGSCPSASLCMSPGKDLKRAAPGYLRPRKAFPARCGPAPTRPSGPSYRWRKLRCQQPPIGPQKFYRLIR